MGKKKNKYDFKLCDPRQFFVQCGPENQKGWSLLI